MSTSSGTSKRHVSNSSRGGDGHEKPRNRSGTTDKRHRRSQKRRWVQATYRELLKHKLVHHDNSKYDGYRLTPLGYDFLAIKAFTMRNRISGVGRRIGVGKESDVYEVVNDEGRLMAMRITPAW